jgi:sulfate permease, SulP family
MSEQSRAVSGLPSAEADGTAAGDGDARTIPRFAVLASLRGYRPAWLVPDVSAGFAIAAVGIPSAIAYPAIAGLPPETGIYASIASVVGYALLGPSRRLIVGPDAATMAVLAGVIGAVLAGVPAATPADRAVAAAVIAMGVGVICLIASVLRLGNLASLLSRPILVGFFVGVAISIIVGQIGRVTGVSIEADGLLQPVLELAQKAGSIHLPSLLLAGVMFAVLQVSRLWKSIIPGPVIVVLLSVALSAALDFEGLGIRIVGDLPAGLPSLGLPSLSGLPLMQLLLGSAAVFVVSFGAGIITARSFGARTGESVNANAELTGFGAANIASGLLGGFPVTSSDSRTAVNLSVGGRSQVAGLTAAVVLGVAILFFSDTMRILPIPALGAILISAALSVIDLNGLRQIWTISRVEFGFALIAMMGAISFGVLQGVVVAIIATFIHVMLNAMQPRVVLMGRLAGRQGYYKLHRSPEIHPVEGLVICFVQGSVLFFNADHVKARLDDIIGASLPDARWLLIDASAITQIDTTGADMLQDIRERLKRHHMVLALAEVQSDVANLLKRAGLSAEDGSTLFFDDVDDAVRAFDEARPDRFEEAGGGSLNPVAGKTKEEET